ncbi:MAG: hypothetical protein ABI443_13230 [Chthoniobacterales bacterium]
MRGILKTFLALAIVFIGYVLWPGTARFDRFDPESLAESDLKSWQELARGQWVRLTWTDYCSLHDQFHFPPLAAARMAVAYTRATYLLQTSKGAGREQKARTFFEEYFDIASRSVKRDVDPQLLARRELSIWTAAASKTSSIFFLSQESAEQWAAFAGGVALDYYKGSSSLVLAAYVYGNRGERSMEGAKSLLLDGYRKLLAETQKQSIAKKR